MITMLRVWTESVQNHVVEVVYCARTCLDNMYEVIVTGSLRIVNVITMYRKYDLLLNVNISQCFRRRSLEFTIHVYLCCRVRRILFHFVKMSDSASVRGCNVWN